MPKKENFVLEEKVHDIEQDKKFPLEGISNSILHGSSVYSTLSRRKIRRALGLATGSYYRYRASGDDVKVDTLPNFEEIPEFNVENAVLLE
ncbi:hypothetical protein G9A89_012860 [Geosiphon pyriformis]|nr:hypothetical protein G9A89_012860 [Geosiphon pyriformis]